MTTAPLACHICTLMSPLSAEHLSGIRGTGEVGEMGDGWMDGNRDGRDGGREGRCMSGWNARWIDGWMNRWMSG